MLFEKKTKTDGVYSRSTRMYEMKKKGKKKRLPF